MVPVADTIDLNLSLCTKPSSVFLAVTVFRVFRGHHAK